jgi:dephospho-CoA kinase
MFRVGVTGGIGSGKTLICKIFEMLGIPVYYADVQAKKMMAADPEIIARLSEYFGNEVIKEGKPDRDKIASIVFSNPDALTLLNSLIHPLVRNDFDVWSRSKQENVYVIEEAAILFETGANKLLDYIIAITAPENIRIKRVMDRDNINRKNILARIGNQMDETERANMADAVIINNDTVMVIPQVVELHHKLLNLARGKRRK